jgi:uncharacterized membrane protein
MGPHNLDFQRRAVSPWTCLGEGWRLIRDEYWLFLGMAFVVFIASESTMGMLLGPAICGIHLCLLRRERDLPVRFEMLFDGFNYFVQSLIATLIIMVPTVLLFILAYFATYMMMFGGLFIMVAEMPPPQGPGAPPPPNLPDPEIGIILLCAGSVIMLACIVIVAIIQTLTIFVYPLIVDKELTGFEAVKLSCRAALGNRGGIFGLLLLRLLIDLVASLFCCVGPILVMPLDLAMVAIAYRQVFAADDPLAAFPADTPPDDDAPAPNPAPSEGITAVPGERPA